MSAALTTVPLAGFEVLLTLTDGAVADVSISSSSVTGGGVGLPGVAGGVPVAVAPLCTVPMITSGTVTVYVAVQVMVAPTARLAGAVGVQLRADRPGNGSTTLTFVSGTSPVFSATNW